MQADQAASESLLNTPTGLASDAAEAMAARRNGLRSAQGEMESDEEDRSMEMRTINTAGVSAALDDGVVVAESPSSSDSSLPPSALKNSPKNGTRKSMHKRSVSWPDLLDPATYALFYRGVMAASYGSCQISREAADSGANGGALAGTARPPAERGGRSGRRALQRSAGAGGQRAARSGGARVPAVDSGLAHRNAREAYTISRKNSVNSNGCSTRELRLGAGQLV
jgi:hypothetical protein